MKHKIRSFAVVVLMLALLPLQSSPAFAQSRGAAITNIYCESFSDVIRYTFDLEIWGMRNQEVFIGIWLVYTGSDYLVEFDGTAKESQYYSDVDGNVLAADIVVPPYRSTLFEGVVFEFPLGVLPPGDYEFYPHFQVQDMDGSLIRWQSHPLCSLTRPPGRADTPRTAEEITETAPYRFYSPVDLLRPWG